MEIVTRSVQPNEETLIFSFLTLAARMPEADEPIQKALSDPFLRKYWVEWGRPGDTGIVIEDASTGMAVACAWVRLFSREQAGTGFVGEDVPELAMGALKNIRSEGFGTIALRQLIETVRPHYRGICLSVRDDNPAVRLYERFSFRKVAGSEMTNRIGTKSYNMYLEF
jgi:hypothetical protein